MLVSEAERLASALPADVVVFSGWSVNGGASEAEQMRAAWRGADVELVIESRARTTVSNATRTLPLLAQRHVRLAVVVSTPLHLRRARFLFARVYGEAGIETRFHAAPVPTTVRALARELVAVSACRLQLRAARAALARAESRA
jgi:uncharacterized SAM-binding protein YcdF (DUF218 family)